MGTRPNINELVDLVTDGAGKVASASGKVIGAIAKAVGGLKKSRKARTRAYRQPIQGKGGKSQGARTSAGPKEKKGK